MITMEILGKVRRIKIRDKLSIGEISKRTCLSRNVIWIVAGERRFGSFIELKEWLSKRCFALWLETAHLEHSDFTTGEMLKIEREHLMAMLEAFDGYVEKTSCVSSTHLVGIARNRYSVPYEWARKACQYTLVSHVDYGGGG